MFQTHRKAQAHSYESASCIEKTFLRNSLKNLTVLFFVLVAEVSHQQLIIITIFAQKRIAINGSLRMKTLSYRNFVATVYLFRLYEYIERS